MAYLSSTQAKQIRENFGKEFPRSEGWRMSLRNENNTQMVCEIQTAPIDLMKENDTGRDHFNVSEYHMNDYSQEAQKIFKRMFELLKTEDYFDESDAMTDYFHVSHYYSLSVGAWDKKFMVGEAKPKTRKKPAKKQTESKPDQETKAKSANKAKMEIVRDLSVPEYQLKKMPSGIELVKISSSGSADKFARQFYFDDIEIYESMFVILLDRQNRTTGYVKVSQGGTAGTVIDIKLIAKYAVQALAQGIILVHNHPSGNKQPSNADIAVTKKTKSALALLDINLLDHLIITADNGYTSLNDESLF